MGISGACCLAIGLLFGGSPLLLLVVAVVWGATIVADSAQFSACVTELSDPRYVGIPLSAERPAPERATAWRLRRSSAAAE
jgi:hypothetical protein